MKKLNKPNYLRKIDKSVFGSKDFKGGNPWGGISADTKRGVVYLTTGNPKPNYVGTARPGKNLFSNSIIAFDVRKKEKLWHFQETCHDLWNADIPSTPILTTINKYEKNKPSASVKKFNDVSEWIINSCDEDIEVEKNSFSLTESVKELLK